MCRSEGLAGAPSLEVPVWCQHISGATPSRNFCKCHSPSSTDRPPARTPVHRYTQPCIRRRIMEGHNVVTAKGKGKNHYGKRFSKKHKAVSAAVRWGVARCGAVRCGAARCSAVWDGAVWRVLALPFDACSANKTPCRRPPRPQSMLLPPPPPHPPHHVTTTTYTMMTLLLPQPIFVPPPQASPPAPPP